MSLMPCFQPGQAFDEGVIVGRILAGYGELELCMTDCLIAIEGQLDTPIRNIFDERGAEKRIKAARDVLVGDYAKAGLAADLTEALEDMDWCRIARNQYAHCHWYWTKQEGLCFVNLEELAKQPTTILNVTDGRRPIDAELLSAQEQYFNYVKEFFMHLADAYRAWDRAPSSSTQRQVYVFPKPAKIARPQLHN
jgi:hypothetical protein